MGRHRELLIRRPTIKHSLKKEVWSEDVMPGSKQSTEAPLPGAPPSRGTPPASGPEGRADGVCTARWTGLHGERADEN